MRSRNNPTTGSIQMLVLKLLSEKDMYGYEMIETLRQRSQNVFEMKAGTMYPLLHDLELQGMLTSYERQVQGRGRIVYHLTEEGGRFLTSKVSEWEKYSNAVNSVLSY